ncbi:PBSX family phage terminase large subunit [Halocella sp. SP3-1]|uniref:PBSX family phage terminase large subunit n=1 Tax=Halocella sp. SP3-1 TaxID=2382161 RepID=UPI000F7592F9|nr:PBSX family phage terminase large subunit [Halocella sp. SP3-1]AZO96144.1 PBSX family phage terminase large subunit [Halocella sp. SP3-1]
MATKNIEILPIYYDYVLDTDYPVYILVGGRNSGKTHFMGQELTTRLNNCKDYKCLIVEDVETNINEGVKTNIIERIDDFGLSSIFHDTKQPAKISHKINNNIALFKGYHSDKQQKRVKSLNGITAAWYEEAENITYEQFKALRMQLRGGEPEDRILYLTMNPINQDGFINRYFFKQKPDEVLEKFEDGRPKVFVKNIEVELEDDDKVIIPCMIIVTTYRDNPYLTKMQIADIEELKYTDRDMYEMLANGKFVKPEGTLIKKLQRFSLSKLDLSQSDKLTALVDTASSGSDSATLGIYAKYGDNRHYLVEAYKDDRDADIVIPIMASIINKYEPQMVYVEENHEGLYFESELKKKTKGTIHVRKFRSTENKHEKILSQSGRMKVDFYVRDDAEDEYNDFIIEVLDYNKDPKENEHDDCIDNIAMYFKHADRNSWIFA